MMLIEALVTEIRRLSRDFDYELYASANERDITILKQEFFALYQLMLPDSYCKILSISNGIIFNGLIIWPTHAYSDFHESLLEANEDLRNTFSDQNIYFATMDEELYVYDTETKIYRAIEYVGQAQWYTFSDAEAMLKFALERAID